MKKVYVAYVTEPEFGIIDFYKSFESAIKDAIRNTVDREEDLIIKMTRCHGTWRICWLNRDRKKLEMYIDAYKLMN